MYWFMEKILKCTRILQHKKCPTKNKIIRISNSEPINIQIYLPLFHVTWIFKGFTCTLHIVWACCMCFCHGSLLVSQFSKDRLYVFWQNPSHILFTFFSSSIHWSLTGSLKRIHASPLLRTDFFRHAQIIKQPANVTGVSSVLIGLEQRLHGWMQPPSN